MYSKTIILLALVSALSACGDEASKTKPFFDGVLEVKGIQLGMSVSDVEKHAKGLKEEKFDHPQSSSYRRLTCKTRYKDDPDGCLFTLANQPVESAEFYFFSDQLGDMIVKFEYNYFSIINSGLTEKFGKPYSEGRTPLENSLTGVESSYIWKLWANGKGRGLILASHDVNGGSYQPQGMLQLADRNFAEARKADSAALGLKPDKNDI